MPCMPWNTGSMPCPPRRRPPPALWPGLAVAQQVCAPDLTTTPDGTPTLRQGVAEDRRISVEDVERRHGRKSRSLLVDGYKRHVLRDLESQLIVAVGVPPRPFPWKPRRASSARCCAGCGSGVAPAGSGTAGVAGLASASPCGWSWPSSLPWRCGARGAVHTAKPKKAHSIRFRGKGYHRSAKAS
jgi:hypothetical protein